MFSKILKFMVGMALGLAIALLIVFNALLLWVATGPRSLDALSPYIAASFQTPHQEFSVTVGETWLIWDGWKHPIDIRLKNITVLTKDGQIFSEFPQISVGIDILSLMVGRILPTSLSISHPSIRLFQNEDRSISLGFSKEEVHAAATPAAAPVNPAPAPPASASNGPEEVPFAALVAPLLNPDSDNPLHKLHSVTILGADINISNAKKGVFFTASDANITFRRNRSGMSEVTVGAKITYGVNISIVDGVLVFDKNSPLINGEVNFSQLMPGTLAALFSDNKVLHAAKFPLTGKSKLSLDMNGTIQRVNFAIDGGNGKIESDYFEKPLDVGVLHIEGQLSNNASDIQIDNMTADINKSAFAASGVISLGNDDISVHGSATLGNIHAKNLHLLWPPTFSPESREWVTTNITEGKMGAGIHVNIPFGDTAKPHLPKEDIDASATLDGAKVRYLPDHPEVTHVKGIIHADGVSLNGNIQSGDWLKDTKLSNGIIAIDDLNADNSYIKMSLDADSPAKDIVRLLSLPRLKHAEQLNLHEDAVAGSVHAHAELGFHFEVPRDEDGNPIEDDITYNVTGEAKDVSSPAFMHKFDIKQGSGKVTINNKELEFKGTGNVNGADASSADVRYLFTPGDDGIDTFIDVAATAPVEVLPRFGYPQFPFLKGAFGVKANLKQGKTVEQSKADIDLTNATVTLTNFGWIKPDKEAANLELTAEKKNGAVVFPSFRMHGKDMEARGSAELNADFSGFKHVEMKQVHYGQNDLDSVIYEPFENGWRVDAHGKNADLSSWLGNDSEGSTFSFEHFPALRLKADVGRVVLGKGRELSDVGGDVDCDAQLCNSTNISGKTIDGKPFTFRILRNPKGIRQLSLHAQSAGAFIKAAGIFDGMEGGDLTITGNYSDNGTASALKGKVDITKYTVRHAPVLAKILSLASLTGLFDTLSGNGITFDRFSAPFSLSKDVITISDAKTHGDAIGMTLEGTITFPKQALDLKGTVIPSYSLNTVLGDVPIIGNVLTGGKGQGVFAARYSISGLTKNPDVSVNPLSILTPGFLRGVFDVLDKKHKDDDDN